jgi:hypothetical protein
MLTQIKPVEPEPLVILIDELRDSSGTFGPDYKWYDLRSSTLPSGVAYFLLVPVDVTPSTFILATEINGNAVFRDFKWISNLPEE